MNSYIFGYFINIANPNFEVVPEQFREEFQQRYETRIRQTRQDFLQVLVPFYKLNFSRALDRLAPFLTSYIDSLQDLTP